MGKKIFVSGHHQIPLRFLRRIFGRFEDRKFNIVIIKGALKYYWNNTNKIIRTLSTISALILTTSIYYYSANKENPTHLSEFGGYFGSIVSSIALIWLIASHFLSRIDLRDQRQILTSQFSAQKQSSDYARLELIMKNRDTIKNDILKNIVSTVKTIDTLITGKESEDIENMGGDIEKVVSCISRSNVLLNKYRTLKNSPGFGIVQAQINQVAVQIAFLTSEYESEIQKQYVYTIIPELRSLEKLKAQIEIINEASRA